MIEYEELRNNIDRYLMERFRYRQSLVYLIVEILLPPEEIAVYRPVFIYQKDGMPISN